MEKNLTTGSVFKAILTFALPYLLSYFLQTLYGMADLYITGRFCGVDSITAVANGSQVMHMLTVIIVGLAMGSTVIIGHAVGAGNMRDAEAAIGNTVTLFMAVSLGFTAVLVAAVRPLVGLIGVPAEAVPGTVQYLTICLSASRSSRHTTSSAPSSAVWGIPKARCTLSPLPAPPILRWIFFSSVPWPLARWVLRWALPFRRP